MNRTPVSAVLAGKPAQVFTTERLTPVTSAVREMIQQKVGSLIVIDLGRVCGIVTERDFIRHLALPGYIPGRTLVQEIMTTAVVCVEPQTDLQECMALMTVQRCRHLPVMKGGSLVGLISIGDLVRHVSAERKAEIHFLTEYILGSYPGTQATALAVFAKATRMAV
jgi:CBS domain-containing protein